MKSDRFDDTNWLAFKIMVIIVAKVWKAIGYLENTIKDLFKLIKLISEMMLTIETIKTKVTFVDNTNWKFNEPLASKEWVRNVWTKGLLLCNIKNSIGIRANISRITAELWESLIKLYNRWSQVAKLYAEEKIKSLQLHNKDDFQVMLCNYDYYDRRLIL